MRVLQLSEKKQRGCQYCAKMQVIRCGKEWRCACPEDECPYHVLDKYESYEAFMESEDSKILVTEFFSSVAGCYELSSSEHTPKRIYSDGDHRVGL